MANTTSKVDNLDICTAIVNINGVAAANIKAINVWDKKSCGGGECNEILLSRSTGTDTASCSAACGGECVTFYTNASGVPTAGDYIYTTDDCSCDGEQPTVTYYSNKCGERSGTCFTTNSSCQVGPIAGCGR